MNIAAKLAARANEFVRHIEREGQRNARAHQLAETYDEVALSRGRYPLANGGTTPDRETSARSWASH
jgi:hypothetical protein